MSKLKVLEIISSLGPTGGGETFAVNLCRELTRLCKLKVVVLHKKTNEHFDKRLKEKNIDVIYLDKRRHFDIANTKELKEIIYDFKPDIIHTENNALISTYMALFKNVNFKKPIVVHTMHLAPKDECSNRIIKFLYKRIFKNPNFVPVAITDKLGEESKKYYNLKNIPVIKNGVDLEPYLRTASKPILERKYDISVVARFSYQKNHEFVLHSLKKLSKFIGNLRVAFVGGGELFEEIKLLSKTLGIDFIEFTGILNDTSTIIKDSKIIALGSRFEANPLTILEGLAAGCVIVSTNVGGIADIISDKNGFLVESGNVNEFVEAFKTILKADYNIKLISEHNFEYGKEFSMSKCAEEYKNLFIKLLDK